MQRQVYFVSGDSQRAVATVLNATLLQLVPDYASQNASFIQTLAGMGLSESK